MSPVLVRGFLLVSALLVSGCDAVDDAAVDLRTPIEDQALLLGQEALVVDLSSVFAADASVTFTAYREGDAVEVTVQEDRLLVRPVRPGRAAVTVTARRGGGTQAATAFAVTVESIQTVGALPDARLASWGDRVTADLATVFAHVAGARLTFTAEPSGDVVAATVDGSVLEVVPVRHGSGAVRVVAAAPDGGLDTLQFAVEVVACGAPPPAGYADLFPLEVGRQWTYAFATDSHALAGGGDRTRTSGTATLEVVSESGCAGGTRRLTVVEAGEGTREVSDPLAGTTVSLYAYSATHTWTEDAAGVTFALALAPGAHIVARYWPAGTPDPHAVDGLDGFAGCPSAPAGTVSLGHDVGITLYANGCSAISWSESVSYTLQAP